MAALVGLSPSGPVVGGLFATAQSAAMGGAVGPFMGAAAPLAIPVAVAGGMGAAGVAVAAEYHDSQQHTMGPPNSGTTADRFVLVCHNWGPVEMRAFASEAEAMAAFHGGKRLRRFVARMHNDGEADADNGHGWHLPWDELAFGGWGFHLDNQMRHGLLEYRAFHT